MFKISKTIKDEKGFVLILVLMIMAAMTAIGMAAIMTSTTDILISRNDKDSKMAFYLAESGLEEAVGRLDLTANNPDGSPNTRFVGERSAQKIARMAGAATYSGDSFLSSDLNLSNMGGSYSVSVAYARETADTWSDGDATANEIVMYGVDFNFSGEGVPATGVVPVYQITSTGATSSGSRAVVTAFIAPSSLNTIPPKNTILFVEGRISIAAPGGISKVSGAVASTEPLGMGTVFTCNSTMPPDPESHCLNRSSTVTSWTDNDMDTYLGMKVSSLSSHADSPSPYTQIGGNTENYHPGIGASSTWGIICSSGTTDDLNNHICDNESKLIYIDNVGGGGLAKINADSTGRGILLVTGDLDITGNLVWEGMIYVMRTLVVRGNVTLYGTLMVDGDDFPGNDDADIQGGLTIRGSIPIGASVADSVGIPKLLRWVKQ